MVWSHGLILKFGFVALLWELVLWRSPLSLHLLGPASLQKKMRDWLGLGEGCRHWRTGKSFCIEIT